MKLIITFMLIILSVSDAYSQWTASSAGIPSGAVVQSLHSSGTNIYAGTGEGVYVSTDLGNSWTQILSGSGTVNSLTICNQVLFAGTGSQGIYFTSNGGVNWSNTFVQSSVPSMNCSGNFVYAVIAGDKVFRSSTSGAIWEAFSPTGNVKSVAANGKYVFAGFQNYTIGGNGGVHYTTDAGLNWSIALPGKEIRVVSCRPVISESIVVAGALDDTSRSGGVYVSLNFGAVWQRTSLDSVPVQALGLYGGGNIHAGIGNHYYPGFQSYAGFWMSLDLGITWVQKNDGIEQLGNKALSCIEYLYPYVYIGIPGHGIFRRSIDEVVSVNEQPGMMPVTVGLFQNYPNPFNPSTKITFSLSRKAVVSLDLFDASGKRVCRIVSGTSMGAGIHSIDLDGSNFPSGAYFCKLSAGNESRSLKIVLVR